jgi:hypothetical protein
MTGESALEQLRALLHQIDLDEQLRVRAVQQAILDAESWQWRQRADDFYAAAPRRNNFHGKAATAELFEARQRCHATALACLRRAALIDWEAGHPLVDPAGEVVNDG